MKKIVFKGMQLISNLAIEVAFLSSNLTSIWHIYQPKMPDNIKTRV